MFRQELSQEHLGFMATETKFVMVNGVVREATPEELEAFTEAEQQAVIRQQELAAAEANKQSAKAKLAALGLTDDEVSALLGR